MRLKIPERYAAIAACLLLGVLASACEPTGPPVDRDVEKRESFTREVAPEGPWRESEVVLPAYPRDENLIEAEISGPKSFKFLIDAESISVNGDGVVRYGLVARSSTGVDSVSYEGMRCETSEYATYAYGTTDRAWSPVRNVNWSAIRELRTNNARYDIHRFYFCPYSIPQSSSARVLDALEHGMPHPASR